MKISYEEILYIVQILVVISLTVIAIIVAVQLIANRNKNTPSTKPKGEHPKYYFYLNQAVLCPQCDCVYKYNDFTRCPSCNCSSRLFVMLHFTKQRKIK
jgi:uncharacterized Zn-finger protein